MIKYKITNLKTKVAHIVTTLNFIYDYIERISGDELLAIDVFSWCELATVGEVYETDTFAVEIIDE